MDQKKELTEEEKDKYAEVQIQRIFHLDSQRTQLVFFRYQTLATVSGIAIAFAGFILASTNNINNTCLAISAIAILLVAMFSSLWIYLYNGKKYIEYLSGKIKESSSHNIGEQSKLKEPCLSGEWPEIILVILAIGIFLFLISFI